MNKICFETVSEIFNNYYQIDTLSHCDILEFKEDKIYLIEITQYPINKDLFDKNIYNNELSEIVKKMWGSFTILLWYLTDNYFKKKKIFVVKVKVNPKYSKILSKLNRELRRFKNGAYYDIPFIIERD